MMEILQKVPRELSFIGTFEKKLMDLLTGLRQSLKTSQRQKLSLFSYIIGLPTFFL